jgi:DNA-binding response OmpR family regulator
VSVLVVDDDPLIAGMLRVVLEAEGYDVREAGDGRQALVAVEAEAPEVMVLDMMMPQLDGFGVLSALRERALSGGTRVAMLTCCSQEDDVRRCLEAGADDYLTKPVDVDVLIQVVQDLLAMDMAAVDARRAELQSEPAALAVRVHEILGRDTQQFVFRPRSLRSAQAS